MNNKNNTENPMEMPKKKEELTDIKKVSTKQENKKIKRIIMTIIIVIIIILLLIGCCVSKRPRFWLNIDINKDNVPEVNLDLNANGKCDVNCSKWLSKKPYVNVTYSKTKLDEVFFNIDTDGDGKPDN